MSESEKTRRLLYRKRRRQKIILQASIIALVALVALASVLLYFRVDQKIYIDYTEKGNVSYKVALKENDFYDSPVLDQNQTYVSELIDKIPFSFSYAVAMETDDVDYKYSYSVNTRLEIVDNKTQTPIFVKKEALKESGELKKNSSSTLKISETASIDYQNYNDLAEDFIDTYKLKDADAMLTVYMNVNVIGTCNNFENNSVNSYTVSATVPLAQTTVDVAISTTVPAAESRVIACNNGWVQNVLKTVAIVALSVDAILLTVLLIYTYTTRNHDINYSIKIKRLYASYKSYLQKISASFDTTGYKVVAVESFEALLNIRDTLQAPILMHENLDNTCTTFVIPAGEILYIFKIKVEDYDELYGPEEPVESTPAKAPVCPVESKLREVVTEAVAATQPTPAPAPEKCKKCRKPWGILAGAALFVGSAVAGFRWASKNDK